MPPTGSATRVAGARCFALAAASCFALGATALSAQEPAVDWTWQPVLTLTGGAGATKADCGCPYYYGGLALTGMIGAGVDYGRTASIGVEFSGFGVLLADSRNVSSYKMVVGRLAVLPRMEVGPFVLPRVFLKAGVGTGSYTVDPTPLVANAPSGDLGVELIRGSAAPLDFVFFADVLGSAAGAPTQVNGPGPAVRYRVWAARAGALIRIRFLEF